MSRPPYGLCAFLFPQNIVYGDAPQLREGIEVVRARHIFPALPTIDALQAGKTEILLQINHAVPVLQPQAADILARGREVEDRVARKLFLPHAATSRAALVEAQHIGLGNEHGLAGEGDTLHGGVHGLAGPDEDDFLLRPRDSRVEQVAVQHGRGAHADRQDDGVVLYR